MNLYLISQSVNNNYDSYDSAVVAAETPEEARTTYPDNYGISNRFWSGTRWLVKCSYDRILDFGHSCWAVPDDVTVTFLAENYDGPAGTICASFNAG